MGPQVKSMDRHFKDIDSDSNEEIFLEVEFS